MFLCHFLYTLLAVVQRSAEEVTNERIKKAAKNAYKIADALLKARGWRSLPTFKNSTNFNK